MTKEIEIRSLIESTDEAMARLQSHGFKLVSKCLQHDIMFDRESGKLFRSGQKIRLRLEGQVGQLTFKGQFEGDGGVSRREEIDISVQLQEREAVTNFLTALGYPVLFQIKKERTTFRYCSVVVTIDNWPIIGPILEFEGPEKEILEMSKAIFPDFSFGNPRLKDLFEERCNIAGKTLYQLQIEYERENGFDLGNLAFLLT